MTTFTRRNLLVFFRDRSAVFFSLLAVLIVIALYAVFLGDTITSGYEEVSGINFLMNSWVISGILAVISVTSTLGALGVMVEDKSKKISKDFSVSPLSRGSIAGGYILSTFCVGVIMSVIALVIGEIYIVASGGEMLSPQSILKVLGFILLAVACGSAIMLLIVSFIKSQNAFGAISTVVGTLIGFLIGVYIPIGVLPAGVQGVIKVFPISYSASAFRQIMMERPMAASFDGAPSEMVSEFKTEMGVVFDFDGKETTLQTCAIVLCITAAVFFVLALLNISRKNKA